MQEAKIKLLAKKLVDQNPDIIVGAGIMDLAKQRKAEAAGQGLAYSSYWDGLIRDATGSFRADVDGVVTVYESTYAPPDFSAKDSQMLTMYVTLEAKKRAK